MIRVLLFAHLREKVGLDEITITEAKEMKVNELKLWLANHYDLQALNQVMTAINEEFVTDDDIVKSGDTVAFIPPVSGG